MDNNTEPFIPSSYRATVVFTQANKDSLGAPFEFDGTPALRRRFKEKLDEIKAEATSPPLNIRVVTRSKVFRIWIEVQMVGAFGALRILDEGDYHTLDWPFSPYPSSNNEE